MLSAVERMLKRYTFQLKQKLQGTVSGEHTFTLPGDGSLIRNIRPFEYGDSLRDIDHKMSAKLGSWQTRVRYADREVDVWLLLDVSRSMRLGFNANKFSHALQLLALGYAWTSGAASRVGAIRLGSDTDYLKIAKPSQPYAHYVLEWLRTSPAPEQNEQANQRLVEFLSKAEGAIKRRSVVLVATDLRTSEIVEPLKRLSQRHEVIVFGVRDAIDDLTVPMSGWYNLEDANTGRQTSGYISRKRQEAAAEERARELEEVENILNGLPLAYLRVSTRDDPLEQFAEFARTYKYTGRRRSA